jgi:hypothetical protein
MTLKAFFLSSIILLITVSCQKSIKAPEISGVWKLVELSNYDEKGNLSQPFGDPPAGYFIYTPEGYMSVQIMRTPPMPRLTGRPNDSIRAAMAKGSLTYFGTYSVDEVNGIVTHEVEGALNPNYVDTNRDRAYRISGDSLIIAIEQDQRRFRRVLLRVE